MYSLFIIINTWTISKSKNFTMCFYFVFKCTWILQFTKRTNWRYYTCLRLFVFILLFVKKKKYNGGQMESVHVILRPILIVYDQSHYCFHRLFHQVVSSNYAILQIPHGIAHVDCLFKNTKYFINIYSVITSLPTSKIAIFPYFSLSVALCSQWFTLNCIHILSQSSCHWIIG